MRFWSLPVLLVLLNGCAVLAIPPALSIASYAISGASYLATGKGLSDHALTELVGKDCATWRIIKGQSICRDFTYAEARARAKRRREVRYDDDRALIASNQGGDYGPRRDGVVAPDGSALAQAAPKTPKAGAPNGGGETRRSRLHSAYIADRKGGASNGDGLASGKSRAGKSGAGKAGAGKTPAARRPRSERRGGARAGKVASAKTSVRRKRLRARATNNRRSLRRKAARRSRDRYIVFGSFRKRGGAVRLARRHPVLDPVVIPARIRGRTYYRVVVRPGSRTDLASALHVLRRKGIKGAYTIRVCRGQRTGPRCVRRDSRTERQILARRNRKLRRALRRGTRDKRSDRRIGGKSITGG